MKLGRFHDPTAKSTFYGIVQNNIVLQIDNYQSMQELAKFSLNNLEVLAPSMPKKIIAAGLNYKQHAAELNMQLPNKPVIFMKPDSAVLAHNAKIIYPDMSQQVDYEAELAVVIAKEAKNISVDKVNDYILGYTPFNDVTARDLQSIDGQWTRAKSFDTFAPMGPFIETEINNPDNLRVQAILNGKIVQDSNTSDMIFSVAEIVSFISKVMTLMPGDVIATGTPQGIGAMQKGDEILIRIEGMDDLRNIVG